MYNHAMFNVAMYNAPTPWQDFQGLSPASIIPSSVSVIRYNHTGLIPVLIVPEAIISTDIGFTINGLVTANVLPAALHSVRVSHVGLTAIHNILSSIQSFGIHILTPGTTIMVVPSSIVTTAVGITVIGRTIIQGIPNVTWFMVLPSLPSGVIPQAFVVPHEERSFVLPLEPRTFKVATEQRTFVVPRGG